MKVRFFEKAKGLIRLGCCSAAVLLLTAAANAATSGWEVRILDVTGTLDNHTKAEEALDGGDFGTVQSNVTKVYPVVDLAGGGGSFGANMPYPSGVTNESQEDFAVRAKANVVIPAGTWTVAFGSDDGGQMTVAGVTFDGRWGTNGDQPSDDQIRFEGNRGHSWTGGNFTVAAPRTTTITASMHERGGGDTFEIAVAQGARPGFGGDFKLLGDGTFGWSIKTNSTAEKQPLNVNVAGANVIGLASAGGGTTLETSWAPSTAAFSPGLTHRWYENTVGNYAGAVTRQLNDTPKATFSPTHGTQWWWGTDAKQPSNMVQYPEQILALTPNPFVEGAGNMRNYVAVMTGEILFPANGTYKFKDGIDDYTSLRIDLNGNSKFESNEVLIDDNAWTSLDGSANGGSPIVSTNITGVTGAGKWLAIEYIGSEGGGGDAATLMWDYDTTKTGAAGVGAAAGFPTANNEAVEATTLETISVPNTHLRTQGVRAINGGAVTGSLIAGGTYNFEVANKTWHDRLTVPGNFPGLTKTLDVGGANLKVLSKGQLFNGDTIKLIDGATVGTAILDLPTDGGAVWDTTSFAATGEVTLVEGGASIHDADFDNDVDAADLANFLSSWTGSKAGNKNDSAERGNLIYDPNSGDVTLDPTGGTIVGFVLGTAGEFKPRSDDSFKGSTPWDDVVFDNKVKQIGGSDLSFKGTQGRINLGPIAPAGLDVDGLEKFFTKVEYVPGLGKKAIVFDLTIVPEPSSLALLGLGVLGLTSIARRRRSA